MFGGIWQLLSYDIGIDLGTVNTLVLVKGKGIVIREPTVVALHKKTRQILAIGGEAKRMLGRTPAAIEAVRPLRDGVISDFDTTEAMLRYFIHKVHESPGRGIFSLPKIPKPRVVVGIPSGVTPVERRAVQDACLSAGAREAYLIEEPMAAAIGARLPIQEAAANVIVDIGGGTTDVVVISMGGVVASRSLRIAGDKLNEDIVRFIREEHNMLIGDSTAENIKIAVGCAFPLDEELTTKVRGRDLITGLPKEITVTSDEVRKAIARSVKSIVVAIRNTIEETPPELIADLLNRSIYLSGGGSLLRGLDKLIAQETTLEVKVVEDPLTAVVRGCGLVLENIDSLKGILVPTSKESYS